MKVVKRGRWPYGCSTGVCKNCNGSGLASGAVAALANAPGVQRSTSSHAAMLEKCRTCGGRGRYIVNKGQCPHFLHPDECALCRHLIK